MRGHGRLHVVVEPREPRVVKLTAEAMEACRHYLAYPDRYQGGGRLTKFGYFAVGSFRQALQAATRSAGLEYVLSPYDFGTDRAPSIKEVRALVQAMQHTTRPYRPTHDRTRITKAFIRASVLAHTGARVGEVALLEPEDLRLQERAVLMPTEKHRRHAGRMERVMSRRRIPLNEYGVVALRLFVKYDLFDRLKDRSRVPNETLVPWYQELYLPGNRRGSSREGPVYWRLHVLHPALFPPFVRHSPCPPDWGRCQDRREDPGAFTADIHALCARER